MCKCTCFSRIYDGWFNWLNALNCVKYSNLDEADICALCGKQDCVKDPDDHIMCKICNGLLKFTHDTKDHIKYLKLNEDLILKSGEFKICYECVKVVFVPHIDHKCPKCKTLITIKENNEKTVDE